MGYMYPVIFFQLNKKEMGKKRFSIWIPFKRPSLVTYSIGIIELLLASWYIVDAIWEGAEGPKD